MGLSNWSIRSKLAVLLVLSAMIPLAVTTLLDVRATNRRLVGDMEQLLTARAEQLAVQFDATHDAYRLTTSRLALLPVTRAICSADSAASAREPRERLLGVMRTYPVSDPNVRGVGLVDRTGLMTTATETVLEGTDLSSRMSIRRALQGQFVISGVYISGAETGARPTVAYIAPVRDASGAVLCAIGLWIHAEVFWRVLGGADRLAGPGSFGTILDDSGIRIAHTAAPELVYRPAGALDPQLLARFVAERRFGPSTATFLSEVRPFPELFERARATQPPRDVFRGRAPRDGKWNYGVARRLQGVPWTVFYLAPEDVLAAQIRQTATDRALLSGITLAIALALAIALVTRDLRRLSRLANATDALARGDTVAHVPDTGHDEVGRLAASFNAMARRLSEQALSLQRNQAELEHRVRERAGLLKAVVNNSNAVIYGKDLEGRYLMVNERFCELLQRPEQEILGRTDFALVDARTAAAVRAVDQRVLSTGKAVLEEEVVPGPDGTQTMLSAKCPLRDDRGEVYGIVGISTDISERKASEQRLMAQLERLKLLDQITQVISAKVSLDGIFQVAVTELQARLPVDFACILARREVAGALDLEVMQSCGAGGYVDSLGLGKGAVLPVDANGLRRCLDGRVVYEEDVREARFPFPARLARAGLGSLVLAPLATDGPSAGVLAVARRETGGFTSLDCEFLRQLGTHVAVASDQARLNDALRSAYQDLKQSQDAAMQRERLSALGQIASGVAHDINNAISPATLYLESLLAKEPGLSAEGRAQLATVARAVDDVATTVARMREFSRRGDSPLESLSVDLNQICHQVIELTKARWSDIPQQHGVDIRERLDLQAQLPAILGSESEVREALVNLVFNAADAMPDGGELTLRTRADAGGQQVILEVQDTGQGMDEDTRRRCLEPFFTTKGERGTGLGLAMVYGVAQRHRAQIGIESQPGRGTTVRIAFPVNATSSGQAPPSEEAPPVRPLRILVVDDDPLVRQALAQTLRGDGHEVRTADGGHAGIEAFVQALATGPYDVVVTDLGMPDVDGREVALAVRKASPGTPVYMLTGWGERLSDDDPGPPPGVDIVMAKPPKMSELRRALARSFPRKDGS